MSSLIFLDTPLYEQVRTARAMKRWTQWEVAYRATEWMVKRGKPPIVKIQPVDVSFIEKGARVKSWRRTAILAVLGLEDPAS